MAFTSSTELLDWLSQNLLLNSDQVQQLRSWLAQTGPQGDLHSLCKELLRRDWLSPFQINQLLKHNADSLVLGANRLHSRLGEGAMGQVYKAWNVRLGRMVAVKMLHPDHALSAKAMDRFRREMQTAAALDHPNIVLLRDADEVNQVPYLVMDYFDGVDLSKKVRQEGPQPIPQAVEWIRQAAIGLQHAFERGIVHRDIKPSNLILVKTADGRTVVKILDFGLAKFERETTGDQPLTQAGRLIGTVDFIAPEQAVDAHNADVRADIYSLGCTLFYLLTGKAPFAGKDHLEKLTARLQGDPPRLRDLRPDVPAVLEDVVLNMMAREPARRYQSPRDAAAALAPFAEVALARSAPMAAPVIQALPATVRIAAPPEEVTFEAVGDVAIEEDANPFGDVGQNDEFTPNFSDERPRPTSRLKSRPKNEDDEEESSGGSKTLMFVAIGLAAVLAIGGALTFFLWPRSAAVVENRATMTIQLDNPPDRNWDWKVQDKKRAIIVQVNRNGAPGPVTVSVDSPPEWLQANSFTIPSNQSKGQFLAIVKSYAPPGPYVMKIVANSPNTQPAFVNYELEVVPLVMPKQKDPPRPSEKKDEKKDE